MNAVIALAVISWPKYSRVARSQTLAQKNSSYVHAPHPVFRAGGLEGDVVILQIGIVGRQFIRKEGDDQQNQVISRHVLPNSLGPILVTAMLDIGTMMMELAGLSFLHPAISVVTASLYLDRLFLGSM